MAVTEYGKFASGVLLHDIYYFLLHDVGCMFSFLANKRIVFNSFFRQAVGIVQHKNNVLSMENLSQVMKYRLPIVVHLIIKVCNGAKTATFNKK